MLKGRLTALASVIALVALTGGAAGLSWATSPISSGSNPLAAAALRQAAEATMGSASFTIRVVETDVSLDGGSDVTASAVYDAPDRYELIQILPVRQGGVYITIGTSTYSRPNGSPTYTKSRTLPGQTARSLATGWLLPLLYRDSVKKEGNAYVSDVPTVVINRVGNNYFTFTGIIKTVVSDGRAVSEDIVGSESRHLNGHSGPVNTVPENVVVTYSAFGTSPPVTAPPTNDIAG